ncbi:hypothetical protein Tco_0296451 [Tanacetum coccineum]
MTVMRGGQPSSTQEPARIPQSPEEYSPTEQRIPEEQFSLGEVERIRRLSVQRVLLVQHESLRVVYYRRFIASVSLRKRDESSREFHVTGHGQRVRRVQIGATVESTVVEIRQRVHALERERIGHEEFPKAESRSSREFYQVEQSLEMNGRNTKLLSGIEDSHHGPSDAMHNPSQPLKDMGEADIILGIRIKHESNGIEISQSYYIEKVLKKFNYFECTPVSTPKDTSEKLMPNNGKLSTFTSNPGTHHRQAIQRVLKYLKKIIDYRLMYFGYPLVLEGYTDANWISNTEDNLSTSGWVFLLGGGAISWASKKQACITGSTMEYEFVALAAAVKEAKWLKNLLLKIPLCAATLAKAYKQMYNGKSRHLSVRHSMIRELIMNGVVSIEFVRSQQNLADHLTKALTRDLVIKSAEGMGLKSN